MWCPQMEGDRALPRQQGALLCHSFRTSPGSPSRHRAAPWGVDTGRQGATAVVPECAPHCLSLLANTVPGEHGHGKTFGTLARGALWCHLSLPQVRLSAGTCRSVAVTCRHCVAMPGSPQTCLAAQCHKGMTQCCTPRWDVSVRDGRVPARGQGGLRGFGAAGADHDLTFTCCPVRTAVWNTVAAHVRQQLLQHKVGLHPSLPQPGSALPPGSSAQDTRPRENKALCKCGHISKLSEAPLNVESCGIPWGARDWQLLAPRFQQGSLCPHLPALLVSSAHRASAFPPLAPLTPSLSGCRLEMVTWLCTDLSSTWPGTSLKVAT